MKSTQKKLPGLMPTARKSEPLTVPMVLRFIVEGPPVPKARARTVRGKNGKVHSFTPPRTAAYEAHVKLTALRWRPANWPLDAKYDLNVVVYRKADRGDMTNYLKAIEDGGNGVLWTDDRQILGHHTRMTIDKLRPRAEVEVIAHGA